jgi:membrane protein
MSAGRRDWLSLAWLVARESVRSFTANRGLESAATLAYYGFLSLAPLLLLAAFLAGLVLRSSEAALEGVSALMADLLPDFNEGVVSELLTLAGKKVWGLVGVLVLVWSMTPFAAAARSAVVRTFKEERRLSYLRAKLTDMAAVLSLLLLFVGLVAAKLYFATAADVMGSPGWLTDLLRGATALAVTTLVLAFFYGAFAPLRLGRGEVLAGALTAAVLLAVMRPVFALVLRYNPEYGYAFGSLKAIFLLIVWVYYTFAVVLLGAEVAANARRREALVLRGFFLDGLRPAPALQRLLARFVRALEPGQVLFEAGEEGREMYYVLGGAVRLSRGEQELAVMRRGDYFGEMSMLLNSPRNATATALEPDTQLVAIGEKNFDTILRENPAIVRRILQEMARRLEETNRKVIRDP